MYLVIQIEIMEWIEMIKDELSNQCRMRKEKVEEVIDNIPVETKENSKRDCY